MFFLIVLAQRSLRHEKMATFVAISGCTRSGKSTLARLLAERLDAEVVRQAGSDLLLKHLVSSCEFH